MCLIAFAWQLSPQQPLILLGNRDEFYARPASPVRFWEDAPQVLAGRDEKEGGTWLGVTRAGRWAALTNYREPGGMQPGELSRGKLVADYLCGDIPPLALAESVAQEAGRYNGFNLLVGDRLEAAVCSNRGTEPRRLEPGLYGLSNHLLDSPWPKTERLKSGLARQVTAGEPTVSQAADVQALLELLEDTTTADDADLPDTGVGLVWERLLGTAFIRSPMYGTRASTVLLLDGQRGRLVERTWVAGEPGELTDIGFALTGVS
ncbi:MAG: NRDE family protein [Fluviicoccus sp.]|uniref:NRDE family protein n=1 Tax=Fluviicoccus sp. TaxID=2003552 RepID=UPI00271DFB22|nr:NRDE family protein [Fluviicoccus sp.]MDO8329665.1 NRDE family protein [Fluviicoccus sp.]